MGMLSDAKIYMQVRSGYYAKIKQFNDIETKPVHIGNNVFLGAGGIVLKGVSIGDDAETGDIAFKINI